MTKLFPNDILTFRSESHYVNRYKSFNYIYIGVVIALVISISILPFISVDITSQSRGIIKTPSESNLLQSMIYGEVVKSKLIEDGLVNAGDTLIVLRATQIEEQIALKQKELNTNTTYITDLQQLLGTSEPRLSTQKYQFEYKQYLSKVEGLDVKIQMITKDFELTEQLYHEKVTAEFEYLQKKNQYETALSEKRFVKEEYRNNWQSEISRLQLENQSLLATSNQLATEKSQYVIKAPVSGTLMQVKTLRAGSFITPGQVLAELSGNDDLLAECYVSPSDIGFIKVNQPVRLQLDAFNYNQWGMVDGNVSAIGADIVSIDNQPVFKVKCKLKSNQLQLKNGYVGKLQKGMTLTGRFLLTQRTLGQLLFDKMDDWMNPKMIK